VQVIRLVMQGSIEEQVLQLSRSKRRLFEKLITPGEAMPQKLSQQDVLKLFSKTMQEQGPDDLSPEPALSRRGCLNSPIP